MGIFRNINPAFILLKKHLKNFILERNAKRANIFSQKKSFRVEQLRIVRDLRSNKQNEWQELLEHHENERKSLFARQKIERIELTASCKAKKNTLRRRKDDQRKNLQVYNSWTREMWSRACRLARISSWGGKNPKKKIKEALRDLKAGH